MAKSTNGTAAPDGNPADFIQGWGVANISDGIPARDKLTEIARALHAVQEFLVEPVAQALKQISADVAEANASPDTIGTYPLPEDKRPVTYADIGRLIAWTDDLRMDCGYLLDPITEIALLAHEDLEAIASGYTPDGVLTDPAWTTRMRRFHGLNEALDA